MITPVIKLVAFADRSPSAIFVAVPNERGRYLRTHPCVATANCGHCKAVAGEPCKNDRGDGSTLYVSVVCYCRTRVWNKKAEKFDILAAEDKLVTASDDEVKQLMNFAAAKPQYLKFPRAKYTRATAIFKALASSDVPLKREELRVRTGSEYSSMTEPIRLLKMWGIIVETDVCFQYQLTEKAKRFSFKE